MYHYLINFSKEGDLIFISHLDLLKTFIRAMRRARIPAAYSQGYNPQPKVTFAAPLALGLEGLNEYLDIFLTEFWEEEKLKDSLNKQFPSGLKINKIYQVGTEEPPFSAQVGAALYVAHLSSTPDSLEGALTEILNAETIIKERPGKKGVKTLDIKPFIYNLTLKRLAGNESKLFMLLATGNKGGVRPQEVLELLPLNGTSKIKLVRMALFMDDAGSLKTPEGLSPEDCLQ